jgi:hypothetical protein
LRCTAARRGHLLLILVGAFLVTTASALVPAVANRDEDDAADPLASGTQSNNVEPGHQIRGSFVWRVEATGDVDRVSFYVDGDDQEVYDRERPFEWTLDTEGFADGTHVLRNNVTYADGDTIRLEDTVTFANARPAPPPAPAAEPPPPPPSASAAPPPSSSDPAANCLGEPADHPVVSYPERRVFYEAQGWWAERRPNGTVPRLGDAEYLHVGSCFPEGAGPGRYRIDARVMGHMLPVDSEITTTRLDEDGGAGTVASLEWNRSIAPDEVDTGPLWRRATVSVDGGELRYLTKVVRPDGDEIHASTGWQVGVLSRDSVYERHARGWYTCHEYSNPWVMRGLPFPYDGVPAGQAFSFPVRYADGAGGPSEVTRGETRLDPDLHAGDNGVLLDSWSGATPASRARSRSRPSS